MGCSLAAATAARVPLLHHCPPVGQLGMGCQSAWWADHVCMHELVSKPLSVSVQAGLMDSSPTCPRGTGQTQWPATSSCCSRRMLKSERQLLLPGSGMR